MSSLLYPQSIISSSPLKSPSFLKVHTTQFYHPFSVQCQLSCLPPTFTKDFNTNCFPFTFSSWKPSSSPLDDLTYIFHSSLTYSNFFISTVSIISFCCDTWNGSTSKTKCQIYSTLSRPWIHQLFYLFSKATMSPWTSLPSLPRRDPRDSESSMTVTSTWNSPIPLIFPPNLFCQSPPWTNQPNYFYFAFLFTDNKVLLSKILYSWPPVCPSPTTSTVIRTIF